MTDAGVMPQTGWRRLWRRTTLTVKAAFLTLLLGGVSLVGVDYWQTSQVRDLVRQRLLDELEGQAQRDRLQFDQHIRSQEQSIRLFARQDRLVRYVESMSPAWNAATTPAYRWHPDAPPPWMPPRSVLRGLVAAPNLYLLDGHRQVREIAARDESPTTASDDRNVQAFLERLEASSEQQHILADAEGWVRLFTIAPVVPESASLREPAGFILWVAPMDNDFLSFFRGLTEADTSVALLNAESDRVVASSRPDRVAVGISQERLADGNILFGKLLDYGSKVNFPLRFVSVAPVSGIDGITTRIIASLRRQFVIGYGVLAACSLILVILIIRRVQGFTEGMLETATARLGLNKRIIPPGDPLLMIREQIAWMTGEILAARDLEQSRQTELQTTNDSLRHSLEMIRTAQEQLVEAEKMASLGALIAGVAHEINTPVGTGVTAASYLEDRSRVIAERHAGGNLDAGELAIFLDDARESSQMILRNLLRASELVRGFKQVAVDHSREDRRLFSLPEYLHDVLGTLQPMLAKTRHVIDVETPPELHIDSYPGAFAQIVTHLVVNALMHAYPDGEAGRMRLRVSRQGHELHLHFSDDGQGMAEQDRQRIFEPFFTTARHRGGMGLGMHIVFNLVTRTLQGTIQCASIPGRGTSYEVVIPLNELSL
ncbi:MAG: HAMP domain-containing histidine kinase [Magnetococcales bacterium]|nr:HAMP domain-containing histidine kinase [Magnetococcales bacterium]